MRFAWMLIGLVVASGAASAARAQAPASQPVLQPGQRQMGNLILDGVPELDAQVRERLMQYQEVRPASLTSISKDGKALLIATRFANTNQLHQVSAPLGMRRQLTFFDEPVNSGGFIPGTNDRQILYAKDKGGDERNQYYRLDLDRGSWTLLTDGKSRHAGVSISHNGKLMAYTGTARNDKDFDLYLLNLDETAKPAAADGAAQPMEQVSYGGGAASGAKAKLVWQVEGEYHAGQFNPDDTKFLVMRYLSEKQTQWFVFDVATAQATPIVPAEPAFYYGSAVWNKEGNALYLTSDREGEFRKLYRLGFEYGEWKCLTPNLEWDVEEIAVDPASGGLAYVMDEDGISRLYFADAWGNNARRVEGLPEGVIGGLRFNEAGGVLGVTVNSSRSPADAYTATYPDGAVTRWTAGEIGGLNPEKFIEPTLIRFPSFDQAGGKPRMIPAFYYKAPEPGPRPVIIFFHGGPESQFLPTFVSAFQYWANELGISIIAPNVRGSTGYGRTYHQLDNGVLREDTIKDVGALLDWIGQQPELDAKRVGVYGGSYGGYMVLGSLTAYPERIKAGIDVVGIASFISFLETTPEFRRDLRREEYGDERRPDVRAVLERASPLKNADKIRAALFVAHGRNDPRVPYTEAEQIVAKMKALQRPVWYALALDEGHGFGKKVNRDATAVMYAMFWREFLLK